jgi:hypothetical protein
MMTSTADVIAATRAKFAGFCGNNHRADVTSETTKASITIQPSHVDGRPQPQPYRLAGNQYLLGSFIRNTVRLQSCD